ncbi:hypothetical protein [Paraburkholderia caribensis]|uniref:hypothetical protein n=1 Tax=Paraburkholderia caribensis TaxID=75105 RepID=UPI0034D37BEC
MKLAPVGIDIAKNVFQIHHVDERSGEIVNKTWYPRGSNVSSRCPKCGSSKTRVAGLGIVETLGTLFLMMTLRGHPGTPDAATATAPSASQAQSGNDRLDAQLASSPTVVVNQASTPAVIDANPSATSNEDLNADTAAHISSEMASSQEAGTPAAVSFSASSVSSLHRRYSALTRQPSRAFYSASLHAANG